MYGQSVCDLVYVDADCVTIESSSCPAGPSPAGGVFLCAGGVANGRCPCYNGAMSTHKDRSVYGEFVFDMQHNVPFNIGMFMANLVMAAAARFYPEATTTLICNPKRGLALKLHTPRLCDNHDAVCSQCGVELSELLSNILHDTIERSNGDWEHHAIASDAMNRVNQAVKRFAIRIREVHAVSCGRKDDNIADD